MVSCASVPAASELRHSCSTPASDVHSGVATSNDGRWILVRLPRSPLSSPSPSPSPSPTHSLHLLLGFERRIQWPRRAHPPATSTSSFPCHCSLLHTSEGSTNAQQGHDAAFQLSCNTTCSEPIWRIVCDCIMLYVDVVRACAAAGEVGVGGGDGRLPCSNHQWTCVRTVPNGGNCQQMPCCPRNGPALTINGIQKGVLLLM
ncbi:hypothetical protein U9M48_036834 [Paspalum notatum var. saurae]|uniref:Uncharacterized protein n=1 Tax=Paspalum notatum var. saurae TaxID=547442 RepID=A0AAQ3UES0_PASNO